MYFTARKGIPEGYTLIRISHMLYSAVRLLPALNFSTFSIFSDLKSWEFLVRMMSADELSEDQLIEIVDAAGVTDKDRMDILAFEAVLDELTRVINEEGEGEEEDEGEDE
jgi:hypothetical protein